MRLIGVWGPRLGGMGLKWYRLRWIGGFPWEGLLRGKGLLRGERLFCL